MKNIILILSIMLSFVFAESVKANCAAFIYAEPDSKSTQVGTTSDGHIYEVIDTVASYHKVKVIDSDWEKEKIGWVWSKRVADDKISHQGVTFRMFPEKINDNIIGFLKAGRKVKILESKIIWYKISDGWVFNTRVNKID